MKLAVLILLVFTTGFGCGGRSSEKEVAAIQAEVVGFQNREEAIILEMQSRPKIFGAEILKDFPENRAELKLTANEQIASLNEIIRLEEIQIAKLRSIRNLSVDDDFKSLSDVLARLFEARLADKRLEIQKYGLVSDPTITTRIGLDDRSQKLDKARIEVELGVAKIEKELNDLKNSKRSE